MNELPPVPSHLAHYWEVEEFLTRYFQASARMSQTEAKEMASKMRLNGNGLFQQHETTLIELYGVHGTCLYNYIHESVYGRVSTLD